MQDFEHKSLEELLKPLREVQRGFLLLRLLGFSMGMALTIIGRNLNAPSRWRSHNSYFREVEAYLLNRPEPYKKEADRLVMKQLWTDGIILANIIIRKGIQDFDNLEKAEKRFVIRILEKLKRFCSELKTPLKDSKSYDEIRLARRLKIEEHST